LKLERSISSLSKKLDRLDPEYSSSNKSALQYWKDKPIIPLEEWIKFRDKPYALHYFPDDFDQVLTYIQEDELEQNYARKDDVNKWNSDFVELMEYTKNPNYGKVICFHCLLSPTGDDPIFIGINRLVSKRLANGKHDPPQYPCEVVNRFQCPYERTSVKSDDDVSESLNSNFDVEDLFKLKEMAFAVEISLAKARKDDSKIRIRNKEELLRALTDKEILAKILEQGSEAPEAWKYIRTYLAENQDDIIDQFMMIKDKVNREELRFY
jgi:hypothetical protein